MIKKLIQALFFIGLIVLFLWALATSLWAGLILFLFGLIFGYLTTKIIAKNEVDKKLKVKTAEWLSVLDKKEESKKSEDKNDELIQKDKNKEK